MKNYHITKINGDTHRPGMPTEGYIVRYRPHPDHGWLSQHCEPTKEAAEAFAATLTPDGNLPV